jgi:hypothetical protein
MVAEGTRSVAQLKRELDLSRELVERVDAIFIGG